MGDEKGIVADRIRSDASAVAGLDDPEAYLFDANLEALVDSVNREGDLPESGLKETHSEFTHALANRLLTLKWVGDHPEILCLV